MHRYAQIGNAIVIEHSRKEIFSLVFLKQGSIRVRVGDRKSADKRLQNVVLRKRYRAGTSLSSSERTLFANRPRRKVLF